MAKNLYRIPVTLPDSPLKAVNTYLVRGERSLLIDTGFDTPSCLRELTDALEEIGQPPETLDLLTTHYHGDHSGLVHRLAGRDSRIYVNAAVRNVAQERLEAELPEEFASGRVWGVSPEFFSSMFAGKKEFDVRGPQKGETVFMHDGDTLEYGGYRFEYLYTPGHCEDHCCLYERDKKLLISGDLVLETITPTVSEFALGEGNLQKYFDSLRRVSKLDVETVCPGHEGGFELKTRVGEIIAHHEARLDETLSILSSKALTVAEIAPRLRWYYADGDWSRFPPTQKFFAMAETMAHLSYLRDRSEAVAETDREHVLRFKKR